MIVCFFLSLFFFLFFSQPPKTKQRGGNNGRNGLKRMSLNERIEVKTNRHTNERKGWIYTRGVVNIQIFRLMDGRTELNWSNQRRKSEENLRKPQNVRYATKINNKCYATKMNNQWNSKRERKQYTSKQNNKTPFQSLFL